MADDSGQEVKEKDPVEAIRVSLQKALKSLRKLLGHSDVELQEEMEEVEGTMQHPARKGTMQHPAGEAGQAPSQQAITQPPAGPADTSDQDSSAE
jgi:hypothetical protein